MLFTVFLYFIPLIIRFLWLSRRFSESSAKQIPLLYGGSVTSQNIISLLKVKNVNGVLIGRTATKPSELNQLLKQLRSKS